MKTFFTMLLMVIAFLLTSLGFGFLMCTYVFNCGGFENWKTIDWIIFTVLSWLILSGTTIFFINFEFWINLIKELQEEKKG